MMRDLITIAVTDDTVSIECVWCSTQALILTTAIRYHHSLCGFVYVELGI